MLLLAGPSPAQADDEKPSAKQERVSELRALVGEASAEETALLARIGDIRERLDELNDQVWSLGREVRRAEESLRNAQGDLGRAEARSLEVAFQLVEAQAKVDAARLALNTTVTALYQRGDSESQALYMSALEASRSPHEMFIAVEYLGGVMNGQRADLDSFLALQRQAEALRDEAEAQKAAARAARDLIESERVRMEEARAGAVAARDLARTEEEREEGLLDEVKARRSEFQRELALLQAESSAIGEMLRRIQAGQDLAPRRKGTFRRPIAAPISSGFGYRVHPIFGDRRLHAGIDYSAEAGRSIRASGGGVVVWAGPRGGYGNLVAIDHGNGLATLYAHQANVYVSIGQRVSTGQVVGVVGSTGMSTGPHLHFETRELGTPADPMHYL